jgi:hypothetical protein
METTMDGDPFITGVLSQFPGQNSTASPTTWVEDLDQAAQQGIPCAVGPMLQITQRHTANPFLPGGEFNPCADPAGTCLIATNVRTDLGATSASEARLATGLVGGTFVGGIGPFNGVGIVGLGRGSNGVTGIGSANSNGLAVGSGVEGRTTATGPTTAGVTGSGRIGMIGTGTWGVSGRAATGGGGTVGVEGIGGPGSFAAVFWGDVRVNGNLQITGTKAAAVGDRSLFAIESPESWFEDFGRAQLQDGRANVAIAPDFASIAEIGDDYHVFLSPEGPTAGLYVTNLTSDGFDVVENQPGTANVSFSYRIVSRRRDVENLRLPTVNQAAQSADTDQLEDLWSSLPAATWPLQANSLPSHLAEVLEPQQEAPPSSAPG